MSKDILFEAVILNCLWAQVSLLYIALHGFRAGRGTAVPAVGAGRKVHVAYFDFRKAFDMVDNDILFTHLAAVGCTPYVPAFFVCCLRERCQYVDCGGCFSQPFFTRPGVSQGSSLGLLLFI